jgi:hypothetical protein
MPAEALCKMPAQAPDKGKNKFLIPVVIDELNRYLFGGSCGKDSMFRTTIGKYPFVAQDRAKLDTGTKQTSNGLQIGFKERSLYRTRSRAM